MAQPATRSLPMMNIPKPDLTALGSPSAPAAVEPTASAEASAPTPRRAARAAVTREAAPTQAVEPVAAQAVPEPAAPVAPQSADPQIVAAEAPLPPAPVAASETVATTEAVESGNDILPFVGAAGLAVLALAAGGAAYSRRKRTADSDFRERDEDYALAADGAGVHQLMATDIVDAPATVRAEPPPVRTATPVAAPAVADAKALPAGFDLSRYGPHVQAAYMGPSADNPSLSLRTRLKRARAFDQRARRAKAEAEAVRIENIARAPAEARTLRSGKAATRPNHWWKPSLKPAFEGSHA